MAIKWLNKDRKWKVRVALRVDGKVVERSRWVSLRAGESKKEAERRAKSVEPELQTEIDALRQRATADAEITFRGFVERHYFQRCASSTLNRAGGENNPRTLLTKQSLVKSRLGPFFGN